MQKWYAVVVSGVPKSAFTVSGPPFHFQVSLLEPLPATCFLSVTAPAFAVSGARQPVRGVAGLPPVQMPAAHVSVCVHRSASLQDVPSVLLGFEQPVSALQMPASWH